MNRFFFVLSAIILIVIGLISVGLLLWKRSTGGDNIVISGQGSSVANSGVHGTIPVGGNTGTEPPPVSPPPMRPEAEVTLDNFIRRFVEIYGSYSTDLPFNNLERTYDDMTERFMREEKKKKKSFNAAAPFYGVTVSVQSIRILEQSSEKARAVAETQWLEERGAGQPQSSRRRMELTLLQEGEGWKVDRAMWK